MFVMGLVAFRFGLLRSVRGAESGVSRRLLVCRGFDVANLFPGAATPGELLAKDRVAQRRLAFRVRQVGAEAA